jgi:hypothetical protein
MEQGARGFLEAFPDLLLALCALLFAFFVSPLDRHSVSAFSPTVNDAV